MFTLRVIPHAGEPLFGVAAATPFGAPGPHGWRFTRTDEIDILGGMALGIDIYRSFQTVTDWQGVKNHGVSYVYVKLSDGGGRPAGGPGDNEVNGARSVGIPVGGYHFVQAHPGPEAQADVFLGEVRRLGATGCVPMLDLEDNPASSKLPNIPDGQKRGFATAFCNHVASQGFRPGVYMNNALAKKLRPDTWGVSGLVIWIARYGARPDAAAGRYDLHQYSSTGQVPGIKARGVDLDESYTDAHLTGGVDRRKVTELMERVKIPVSMNSSAVRLYLSGSETSAIIIRPHLNGDGFAAHPVWLGNIYAWGSDKSGIGHNPVTEPGFDPKVMSHRRYEFPGAVWADLEYSSAEEFDIDIVG
jgi:lysozyme